MSLTLYGINDIESWISLYETLGINEIVWQPSYLKLWELNRDGSPLLAYFEDEYGSVIYPFLLRKLPSREFIPSEISKNYFDITTPYGYGGPLIKLRDYSKIDRLLQDWLSAFSAFCQNKNIVSEFIRFHPLVESHKYFFNKINTEVANSVVFVDLTIPKEQIWENYEYNNQKNIKKAIRSGIEILVDHDFLHLDHFKDIYNHTMQRCKANSYYFFENEFFNFIKCEMRKNAVLFFAKSDGKLVSTELALFDDNTIYSFLGGTLSDYFPLRPNNLLKHELILWAKKRNIKYYLMGGGYSINDGLFKYKHSFSSTGVKPYVVGKVIHNREIYLLLEKKMKEYIFDINPATNIEEIRYFPIYRYEP